MNESSKSLWYVGKTESWLGPLSEDQIVAEIQRGSLSWTDFVWNEQSGFIWRRISDLPQFKLLMPAAPAKELITEIRNSLPQASAAGPAAPAVAPQSPNLAPQANPPLLKALWYLQCKGTQFGPTTTEETLAILRSGKIKGLITAKKKGEDQWHAVSEIKELSLDITESDKNKRVEKRIPLLASVKFWEVSPSHPIANEKFGICRNISLSGMLIHTEETPFSEQSRIKLEVNPITSHELATFSTEALVVKVFLKDQNFSVKFSNTDSSNLQILNKYLIES